MSYISKVKIGGSSYDIKAVELTDELYSKLKQSAMRYKGSITKAELDALTDQINGDVYTISDEEYKEVVWYKAEGATTGSWIDLGRDDAHAHSVTINNKEKTFDGSGKVSFTLYGTPSVETKNVLGSVKNAGYITDNGHTHTLNGDISVSFTDTNVNVLDPTTSKPANYTPEGKVEVPTYSLTGANYTPEGSLEINKTYIEVDEDGAEQGHPVYTPAGTISGTAVSIPKSTYLTGGSITSDAIKGFTATLGDEWQNLVTNVTTTGYTSKVSISIPGNTYITSIDKNPTATNITFTGTQGTATASYTPSGSVSTTNKTIVTYDEDTETLDFGTNSIKEATGAFTGTKATISSTYTPSGTATIPANTYLSIEHPNSTTSFSSTETFLKNINVVHFDTTGLDVDQIMSFTTSKASVSFSGTRNTTDTTLSVTQPTFTGTPTSLITEHISGNFVGKLTTITPTLNKSTINTDTCGLVGNGVVLQYQIPDITSNLSIANASTGITYTNMTFDDETVDRTTGRTTINVE